MMGAMRTSRAPRGRRVGRALATAVLLVLAACSTTHSSSAPSSSTTPAPSSTTTAPLAPTVGPDGSWTTRGLPVHSRLSATKDSIVYAGVDGTALVVTALDPATGAERWRHPADVSDRVHGVELSIYTDDTTAYFLTPPDPNAPSPVAYRGPAGLAQSSGESAQLSAVTTATGETRWSTALGGLADPDVHRCGDAVCVTVDGFETKELWRIDRATGDVLGKATSALPQGPGDDAAIDASDNGGDMSQFIVASRGPVYVGQFSSNGEHLDWSVPATTLYPNTDVSPNGGWEGWSTPTGWVVWLGSARDRAAPKPQPGDSLPRGAVAGIGQDGAALWFRADRHPCFFLGENDPTLCDGALQINSSGKAEARPSAIEGIDTATGATTWTVALNGTIDEFDATGQVLRLDDHVVLVDSPSGLVHLDLVSGPTPAPGAAATTVGWCQPARNASDDITSSSGTGTYTRSTGSYPCRMGGDPADQPPVLPVPSFAGVDASGWSAWIVDGTVHALPDR